MDGWMDVSEESWKANEQNQLRATTSEGRHRNGLGNNVTKSNCDVYIFCAWK